MEKNKKKMVLGIIFVVVLLLIGMIAFVALNQFKTNPKAVLETYMTCINEQKYDEMYERIASKSKDTITKEDFIARNKNIYEGMEAKNLTITNAQIEKTGQNERKVTYDSKMNTSAGEISFSNTAIVLKEGKKEVIVWNSNLIFPELDPTDKVKISSLKAKRGTILDRNDVVLAGEGSIYSVGLVPGKMGDQKESSIAKMAELLDISVESIQKDLAASYVKEDSFVSIKNIAKREEELKNTLLQIPGVKIASKTDRVYPFGEATSHLVGYIQSITAEELKEKEGKGYRQTSVIGKTGLEKAYEDRLKGTDGSEIYIVDSQDKKKKTLAKVDIKNGETIKLTIDATIQNKIYTQMKDTEGVLVTMNPKTGEILALVSTPTFNSNDFVLGMTSNQWNTLKNNEKNPLLNRYTSTWCPGSTFKPVTGAIGLTTGKLDPAENFGTSGLSWKKDSSWGDYTVTTLTLYEEPAILQNALIRSDNIYFAKAALKIGKNSLEEGMKKIGFGEEIPFAQGLSKSQISNNNTFHSEIQLADSGYGQGQILVNPIHMASIYSAFVNEGNMIKPYIEYKSEAAPEIWIKNAFSKAAAEAIKEDLIQVVESPKGTAHDAKVSGVTIGGKTGTAEIKVSKEDTGEELGWFNAFTADSNSDKQYVTVSMIEDAKQSGGSHALFPKVQSLYDE